MEVYLQILRHRNVNNTEVCFETVMALTSKWDTYGVHKQQPSRCHEKKM